MLGCHCGPLFSSSTSPPNAQPHLHPSTLPFSFAKQTGNPGICAPAWLPSWLRGHHRTSAPSPHEAKNLCVPSAHRTDKQARNDDGKSSFLWDRSNKESWRELLAWHGEEGGHGVCLPYPPQHQKPRQPILARITTRSRRQAGVWMERCTAPFLITENYSC